MSFIFVQGQPGDTAGIAARTTLPMGGGAGLHSVTNGLPCARFRVSVDIERFDRVLRLPQPMVLNRFECLI
jgi:hypothetical protein